MDLGGTNGLIIGAAGPTGTDLAQRALDAGVTRLVLCDTAAAGTVTAPVLDARRHHAMIDIVRLERGDPIELAQLFACVRHDHGPIDWVCAVGGPGATAQRRPAPLTRAGQASGSGSAMTAGPPAPHGTDTTAGGTHVGPGTTGTTGTSGTRGAGEAVGRAGSRPARAGGAPRPLAEVIPLTPAVAPSPWPELSLARIVARTEQAFVRSALVTRLALEEFRHRGGALLHVWASDAGTATDALWEANRAAVEALVSAGDAGRPEHDEVRIGFVETAAGAVHDLADRLAVLLGREPSPVVSLIRDNP